MREGEVSATLIPLVGTRISLCAEGGSIIVEVVFTTAPDNEEIVDMIRDMLTGLLAGGSPMFELAAKKKVDAACEVVKEMLGGPEAYIKEVSEAAGLGELPERYRPGIELVGISHYTLRPALRFRVEREKEEFCRFSSEVLPLAIRSTMLAIANLVEVAKRKALEVVLSR